MNPRFNQRHSGIKTMQPRAAPGSPYQHSESPHDGPSQSSPIAMTTVEDHAANNASRVITRLTLTGCRVESREQPGTSAPMRSDNRSIQTATADGVESESMSAFVLVPANRRQSKLSEAERPRLPTAVLNHHVVAAASKGDLFSDHTHSRMPTSYRQTSGAIIRNMVIGSAVGVKTIDRIAITRIAIRR